MSDDKTEEPTESKLRKAREQGQVAKSADLAVAVSMLGVIGTLKMLDETIYARLRRIFGLAFDLGAHGDLALIDVYRRMGSIVAEALLIVVPVAIVAALCAAASLAAQVGLQVSMEAITPKPENIDPSAGLKRIFSTKSLVTLLQMVVKAVALGTMLWMLVVGLMPMLGGSTYQSVGTIGAISWSAIFDMLIIAALLFAIIGPIDYAIQRWQFMKSQRMSKDEVKKEHKGQEGDPEIKQKRKQIAQEDARSSPRKAVAGASAVIVNPTHYAVAVRYRPEEFGLPTIVTKGVDSAAFAIRRHADEQGVPIFEHPPLARALHVVALGEPVPEQLFEAVAAVLRWVDEIGRNPNGRDGD